MDSFKPFCENKSNCVALGSHDQINLLKSSDTILGNRKVIVLAYSHRILLHRLIKFDVPWYHARVHPSMTHLKQPLVNVYQTNLHNMSQETNDQ